MNVDRCLFHRTIIVRAIRPLRQTQPNKTRHIYNCNNPFAPRISVFQRRALGTMASSSGINHLLSKLDNLTLDSISAKYPATYPEVNPFDLYRVHIAEVLAPITGVAAENIRPVISWTNALDKGDFILPVPALRIKGAKPDALGAEWAAKVKRCASYKRRGEDQLIISPDSSLKTIPFSRSLLPTVPFFLSSPKAVPSLSRSFP